MAAGGVAYVTAIQTAVEPRMLRKTRAAKGNADPPQSGESWSAAPSNELATIAEISLQAFTRHQNQRAMYTRPMPAPSVRSSRNSPEIDVAKKLMPTPTASARSDATRPAST